MRSGGRRGGTSDEKPRKKTNEGKGRRRDEDRRCTLSSISASIGRMMGRKEREMGAMGVMRMHEASG